jgi:hypothetical protein
VEDRDPEELVAGVKALLAEAPGAFAESIEKVAIENGRFVVGFRKPASLLPREVAGRSVDCLLY